MRPRLKKIKASDDYKLELFYVNGERKVYDFAPLLNMPMNKNMGPAAFETAEIAGCGVAWSNGMDICPDELYYNSKTVS